MKKIERYVELTKKIKALEKEQKELKDSLISCYKGKMHEGQYAIENANFKFSLRKEERETVNYRGFFDKYFDASKHEMPETKKTEFYRVTVR